MSGFIKFAIVGQVAFGDDAQHRTPVEDDGTIIKSVVMPEGGAHHQNGQQVGRSRGQIRNGLFDGVEQSFLLAEVIYCVAGQSQFRKHAQHCAVLPAGSGSFQCALCVGGRVRQSYGDCAGCNTGKALMIQRVKCGSRQRVPSFILMGKRAQTMIAEKSTRANTRTFLPSGAFGMRGGRGRSK
ncbi:hypothetical protein Amal_04051 [Acetobacter malorum]|uniref:Uncharacterized protein n=1 Tax=Acetobacter malorum TaxID=178901 RepID=A0A177FWU3_9PROT|nr:hypothetical protein Amal_04051 [Acetobacter malorum]